MSTPSISNEKVIDSPGINPAIPHCNTSRPFSLIISGGSCIGLLPDRYEPGIKAIPGGNTTRMESSAFVDISPLI